MVVDAGLELKLLDRQVEAPERRDGDRDGGIGGPCRYMWKAGDERLRDGEVQCGGGHVGRGSMCRLRLSLRGLPGRRVGALA